MLRLAMDGMGCNTELVNEIFCTLSTAEIQAMRQAFEQKSDRPLADRLRSELSGDHETLIIKLLTHGRDESMVNEVRAREQANELSSAIQKGKTMLGGLNSATEAKVIQMISDASWMQCQAIKVGRFTKP
jgi:hypothetical protein